MPSAGQPTSMRIDPTLYAALQGLVQAKNRHTPRSTSIKHELEAAIRQHLTVAQTDTQTAILAPAIHAALDERIDRLEHRMAGIMAKSGLDAATALYVLLYCLDETNKLIRAVQPDRAAAAPIDVREWYERARTRAIRHFREKDPLILQVLADERK